MQAKSLGFPVLAAAYLLNALSAAERPAKYTIPLEYYKLKNGLRVVLAPDTTAPTVLIGVYYKIGFRIEPKDRTGFAHLFEHMMFQGSKNLGKMEFVNLIQKNGGVLNGSTRFDFTNYYEAVPSHKLETILWAEADRMRGLDINEESLKNQQGVVSNEVKVNVLNSPYGGFPWLDIPQVANTNWYNAHNFYGDLEHLEAATVDEVKQFFKTYYSPNNATLVVAGDFEIPEAKKLVAKYFDGIPASDLPKLPDLTEPIQKEDKRSTKTYPNAKRPALAFAYHVPPRNTPEYYAMGLLDQLLLQGDDSLLHQELVKKRGYTNKVEGGINSGLGNMYNYSGPMLWTAELIHDPGVSPDQIMTAVNTVMASVRDKPLDQKMLDRALVKLRSDLYSTIAEMAGLGKLDLLASFALFDDNPARINTLEDEFRKVTPAIAQKTAREYFRDTNRTVLIAVPPQAKAAPGGNQ